MIAPGYRAKQCDSQGCVLHARVASVYLSNGWVDRMLTRQMSSCQQRLCGYLKDERGGGNAIYTVEVAIGHLAHG